MLRPCLPALVRPLVSAVIWFSGGEAIAATPWESLPVREVTVFKDGHAFVLHEGTAAVDAEGLVRIDDLPVPVIGTFWPFSSDPRATLTAAAASQQRIELERTALTIRELLEANIGAELILHDNRNQSLRGTLLSIPRRDPVELGRLHPRGSRPRLSEVGSHMLFQTDGRVRTVQIDSIVDLTFIDPPRRTFRWEELRDLLELRLDWGDAPPQAEARVGMTYLQKGLRWIPQYRITLLEKGRANVELQATLLNEMTDLSDVTAHLVIGVPTFPFEATLDPLALGRTLEQLSGYFRKSSGHSDPRLQFSNAIMLQTQVSRMSEHRPRNEEPAGAEMNPEIGRGDEDLFLFTIKGLTLRRGERLVTTLGRWEVDYEDLYRLEIPLTPPRELQRYFESQRQADLAGLQYRPRVMHVARLRNTSSTPFTTAPALLMKEGRILSQGMMTYTAAGTSVDLEITTAVNVTVDAEDNESGRVPNALRLNDSQYQRIDLAGGIRIRNHHPHQPIRLQVERMVLGTATAADLEGAISHPVAQHGDYGNEWPAWWGQFSWPVWWHRVNRISRIRWTREIPAGQSIDLNYQWHYFWN